MTTTSRHGRAFLLAIFTAASTMAAAQDRTHRFDIGEQPLATALLQFSEQSDTLLVMQAELIGDRPAPGVKGDMPVAEALDRLLRDSGLEYSVGDDGGVTIVKAAQTEESRPGKSRPASTPVPAAQNQTSVAQNPGLETSSSDHHDEERPLSLEEILVTGSRIRGAQNASPVVTITRQEIDQAGIATVEELIDNLPQNFGGGASLDTLTDTANDTFVVGGNVGNDAGGTSVNLRGLGTSSTLVLLNGRRLSPGGFGAAFTNIASIPVTAIERVEVLTDGASAIYGSDAIGGVVNFILRDDYEGVETRLRYGSDSRGDTSNVLLGQSFGNSWDQGNVLFTYEYYDSENLANEDRDFTSTNDLRRFGGTDVRAPGGNPANISAGGRLWPIPTGQDGTSLTAADFPVDANGNPLAQPNRFNNRSLGDVLPGLERHSAFLRLAQTIGRVELFTDARFSTQETEWRRNFSPINIVVTDANPFFVDPTGTGLSTITVEGYALGEDLGPQIRTGEIDSLGAALGARFELSENWNAELTGNWAKEQQETNTNLALDLDALDAAVNPVGPNPDPDQVFNPFGDGSNTSPAVIESLVDRSPARTSETDNELWSVNLNVDGAVLDLPGGTVQVAAGTEFREESILTINNVDRTGDVTSDLSRDVTSVYTEVFVPLVSGSNGRPGMRRFELSLAGRYEDYSDFGDSVNPKAGLVWSPTRSLTLRGTWGTSFKAPALLDLDVSRPSANFSIYLPQFLADIGVVPFPMIARAGNSEDLQPEEATTWTAGVQWRPERVGGLSLDVTYFNVEFDNRIALPITNFAFAGDPRFASLVNDEPTLEQIAALINDPRWFNPTGASEADLLSGAAPVAIVDGRLNNVSRSVVTGFELQFAYRFETGFGSFDMGLNGNYLFDFEQAFLGTDPLVDEVDTYGRPVDFRARANATWSRDAWSVSGFLNYTDGYTENISDPARSVDSWITTDLTIAYRTGDDGGFFRDTRLSLSVQNLFDEDPPFVNTPSGQAYDSFNADPLGRTLAFSITKDW